MAITKDKPVPLRLDRVEDTQSIGNVDQMYKSFIVPIDGFRSLRTSPSIGSNNTQNKRGVVSEEERQAQRILGESVVNTSKYIESRAHAFYRMVGFPVVSLDGFYNSGHDPNKSETITTRTKIDESLKNKSADLVTLMSNREFDFKQRRNIFARQDDVSIAYALMMRHPKRFLFAQTNYDPSFADPQTQPIAGREKDLATLNINPLTVPFIAYKNVSHILKPFAVNPDIEFAVTPEIHRRICVPFLPSIADTKSTSADTLKRPIIEYILTQRLDRDAAPDSNFLKQAQRILTNNTEDNSDANIRTALLALSGENVLEDIDDEDILDAIQGFTSIQSSTILLFTKAIKVAVQELDFAIREFDIIRTNLNIQPVPNKEGPEFGGKIRTAGGVVKQSATDIQIANLKLKELNEQFASQSIIELIGDQTVYASAVVADISKKPDKVINKLKRHQDELGRQAISHLRTIEIVTGEVSGIGLVDILAIYTALWAIDMEDLVGLLDQESLSRLATEDVFQHLKTTEVQKQATGTRPDIADVLESLESQIFNILTFADKLFEQRNKTPRKARGGSIK